MLRVEKIRKTFGGIVAVDEVSLAVEPGQIHGLLGPNGSGKTTALDIISGYLRPDAGEVYVDDRPMRKSSPARRARFGLARGFQHPSLLEDRSALENVALALLPGLSLRQRLGRVDRVMEQPWSRPAVQALEVLGLLDIANERVSELSFGLRPLLGVARVLASGSDVLLMDEPAAGLGAHEMGVLREALQAARDQGAAILLIEHNVQFILDTCEVVTVLNFGQVIAHDTPQLAMQSPEVRTAYLGSAHA